MFGEPAPGRKIRGQTRVGSPDGRNEITVEIVEGRLAYSLTRDGRALILPSTLGFDFRGARPLRDGLRVTDTTRQSHDEWWTQPCLTGHEPMHDTGERRTWPNMMTCEGSRGQEYIQNETLARVGGGLRLRCRGHLTAGKSAIDAVSAVSSGPERTNRTVYLVRVLPSLP